MENPVTISAETAVLHKLVGECTFRFWLAVFLSRKKKIMKKRFW